MVWSAITAGYATLSELENDYSLDDLYRLVAYTRYQADRNAKAQEIAHEQAKASRAS